MSKKKKLSTFFKNNSKTEVIEINEDNIQSKLDEINLKKIQNISKEKYNENIKNNMIEYFKINNNTNLEYKEWVKQFNEQDYTNEFTDKIRNNEIYHEIWNDLNKTYKDFEIIY
tara:strand:- start:747 stop:1088 length:342 start_codon:yes stop_codon:yes gene_type:complete